LLGYWGSRLLVGIAPEGLPRLNEVSLDARVLLFTLLATCLTVVLFGLVPTFQGSRLDLTQSLKGGGRGAAGGGRQRGLARSLLVIAELMLTVVLMIGAGLLMRSFMLLVRVDPGFDSERVLTMDVLLPMWKYERPQTLDFYSRLLERLEAMPGVESAAAVMARPVLSTNSWGTNLTIEGRATTDQELKAAMNPITPDYFSALRIPLRKGRAFTAGDDMNAPGVVIVSEDLAWRYFPGEDPIGKVITHDIDFGPDVPRSRTIVGVVGDVKQAGLASDEEPQMYVPHRQVPFPHMSLVVRTKVDPLSLVPEVRSTVWSIDREVPLEKVGTMSDILGDSVGRPGFYTALLSAFAAAGLIMAAVGLYGVLAYAVSQRTHELGIRMALGARPGDISSLVVRQGMSLALIGLVLGLVASLALSRWLKGLLYEIQPTDVTAYGLALLVVIGVVLLACLIPARRATRVDPAVAIRYE
jgi:putative ABC transport system permease protein